MGCGEEDDSFFLVEDIQPDSFNTTKMIEEQLDDIDFVLHIGDISYARGFSSVVSHGVSCTTCCYSIEINQHSGMSLAPVVAWNSAQYTLISV